MLDTAGKAKDFFNTKIRLSLAKKNAEENKQLSEQAAIAQLNYLSVEETIAVLVLMGEDVSAVQNGEWFFSLNDSINVNGELITSMFAAPFIRHCISLKKWFVATMTNGDGYVGGCARPLCVSASNGAATLSCGCLSTACCTLSTRTLRRRP